MVIDTIEKQKLESIRVDDIEVKNGEAMPTYPMIKALEKIHPDKDFYFIIGSDLVPWLPTWGNDELLTEIKWLIYKRPGYELEEKDMPDFYHVVDNEDLFSDMSSSKVRDLFTKDFKEVQSSLEEILEAPVLDYIVERNLHEKYKDYYQNQNK